MNQPEVSDQHAPNLFGFLTALCDAESFQALTLADASLVAGKAQIGGRTVWLAASDSRVARGAFSVADCKLLERLFIEARGGAEPIILLLNSAGVRVDQGLLALGAFRACYKKAIEAATDGQPILACVGHNCFGGASMLALLAEQRVYARDARLGLSGPRVIEAAAGHKTFDAADPVRVAELMGASARREWHDQDVIADLDATPLRRIVSSWLTAVTRRSEQGLIASHEKLASRLRGAGLMVESAEDTLVTTDFHSRPCTLTQDSTHLLSQFDGEIPAYIGLLSRGPIGPLECWTLADVLLDLKDRQPGRSVLLALDVPGHSSLPRDEQILLTEYVVHLALTLMQLRKAGHYLRLILVGNASGAIYAALSAAVDEVLAAPGALVQVLPPQAVHRITGQRAASPTVDHLVTSGVADRLIPGAIMRYNTYHQIEAVVKRAPHSIALDLGGGALVTYKQLDETVSRFHARLLALGLQQGDRVVAQIDKSVEALYLYLACLRSGIVFVPLNTAYQQSELEHFVVDAQPKLVVCRSVNVAIFASLAEGKSTLCMTLDSDGGGSFIEFATSESSRPETAHVQADEVAVIIYTSGTTGRSKGAMVTHRNLVSNARTLIDTWQFSSSDVLLHALPVFHVHGLFVANHCALFSGARIIWRQKYDPAQVVRDLSRATVFMGVPTFYTRLLEQKEFDRALCSTMRLFISGSAPLLAETFRTFEQRSGHRILERYGMSEAGMIASNPLLGERRAETVGFPLPGVDVRVADRNDQALPAGQPGSIQIRGSNVFAGYWRMPEKSAEEFTADGFFRTGDLGRFDLRGYLSIVGRAKDLIISGGYNVYPKEVELLLDEIPGVSESAVIGLPDPDFGEAVTAIIVLQGTTAFDEYAAISLMKQRIANFKVPKRIIVVDELPRNAMGKVQKAELRSRFAAK